ncbi:ATP synthase F0 subunit B [Desulfococcaceae bacterium HSG8]|nr:ATP synthase F0 subunit B [Desulfococcaceae bacterium HSG8]
MKKIRTVAVFFLYVSAVVMCLHTPDVLGAEEPGNWRGTYDEVMLWINFGILAFVLIKFGRTPLMNFLKGRREEVAREIKRAEQEKEKIEDRVREASELISESESRFAELRQKIIDQGEKRKAEVIEDARQQSQMMLETAKQRIDNRILQEKDKFRSELIDQAVAVATRKLPEAITPEDDQKFVDQYVTAAMEN